MVNTEKLETWKNPHVLLKQDEGTHPHGFWTRKWFVIVHLNKDSVAEVVVQHLL